MRPPAFDQVRELPLASDDDVLERVAALVGRARRRQLWLMFLDDASRQLPLLMPLDLPRRPPPAHAPAVVASLVARGVDAVGATQAVVAIERRGGDAVRSWDHAWAAAAVAGVRRVRLCRDEECPGPAGCPGEPVRMRGPALLTAAGPRWIAPDDLLAELARLDRASPR